MSRYTDHLGRRHATMVWPEMCGAETCGVCSMGDRGDEFARFLHLEPDPCGWPELPIDHKRARR